MSTPCDRTLCGGMTFFLRHHPFGHDFKHWSLANPYIVNAALQLKRLPTPDLKFTAKKLIIAVWYKKIFQL